MDLKNIDLKNLNIEDIKKKILQFTDKKTLIKIGISVGAIIIFLIIYYSILNPLVNKKKLQLDEMNKKKEVSVKLWYVWYLERDIIRNSVMQRIIFSP